MEENPLVTRPPRRITVSTDGVVADLFDPCPVGGVPAASVPQVKHDRRLIGCGERITVHSDTVRGGHLRQNPVS